ncbi:hypothetical protein BTH160X_60157 [Brochothrix thermosphacta]|nr:hypothetical protein BTH160X_60157 [Brochothrix thermosphacta]
MVFASAPSVWCSYFLTHGLVLAFAPSVWCSYYLTHGLVLAFAPSHTTPVKRINPLR